MTEKRIAVNVTLAPAAAKTLDSTLAKLRAAGLQNAVTLETIGIVTGEASLASLQRLSKVEGVTVERGEEIRLSPPDSPVQ